MGGICSGVRAAGCLHCDQANTIAVLPLPGVKRTLVIADTSGLHHRGKGLIGAVCSHLPAGLSKFERRSTDPTPVEKSLSMTFP